MRSTVNIESLGLWLRATRVGQHLKEAVRVQSWLCHQGPATRYSPTRNPKACSLHSPLHSNIYKAAETSDACFYMTQGVGLKSLTCRDGPEMGYVRKMAEWLGSSSYVHTNPQPQNPTNPQPQNPKHQNAQALPEHVNSRFGARKSARERRGIAALGL